MIALKDAEWEVSVEIDTAWKQMAGEVYWWVINTDDPVGIQEFPKADDYFYSIWVLED